MSAARILVVEDNTITRRMFRVALASQGWTVDEAGDARAALDAVSRGRPDLALVDLTLPDMAGEELLTRLFEMPGPRFPVIATSGFLSKLEQARSLAVGFVDHLFKPVDPIRLIAIVRALLQPAPDPAGAGRTLLVVDGDPARRRVLTLELEQAGYRVIVAGDTREALERVGQSAPDAIVVDALVPDQDGFQLCLALRQHPRTADCQVIVVSGAPAEESDRQLAARVGASALIQRSPGLVLEAVAKALREPIPAPVPSSGVPERLALHEAAMGMLARIRDTSRSAGSLDTVLQELLRHALDATGISVGGIYLLGADGEMELGAQQGFAAAPEEVATFFGGLASLRAALAASQAVQIPGQDQPLDREAQLLERAGTRSLILVPLGLREERIGVLVLAAARRQTGAEWLGFAEAIGVQIAQAVMLTRTMETLTAEQERFRAIAENIRAVFFLCAPDRDVIQYISPAYEQIWGQSCASLYRDGSSWLQAVHPDDRERVASAFQTIGRFEDLDQLYRIRQPSGDQRWIHARSTPLRDAAGRITAIAGIAEDVTELKQSEEELRLLQSISSAVGEADSLTDALTVVLEALCRITGWRLGQAWVPTEDGAELECTTACAGELAACEAFRADSFARRFAFGEGLPGRAAASREVLWSPDLAREPFFPRLPAAQAVGLRAGVVLPIIAGNELVSVIELFWTSQRAVDSRLVEMVSGVAQQLGSVLRRKLVEEALLERTALAELTADVSVALTTSGTLATSLTRCAESIVRRVGATSCRLWTLDEASAALEVQALAGALIDGRSRAPVGEVQGHKLVVEGQLVGVLELSLRRPLKPIVTKALSVVVDMIALGVRRELTERARAATEAQLRQAQKMEAVGQLAGGIAHDFNNILAVVMGYSDMMLGELRPDDPLVGAVSPIRRSADRAAALTRQLLAFSRKQVLQPRVIDLNAVIRDIDRMLRRLIGENLDYQVVLLPGLGAVKADVGQVEQVIMNLVVNARDAMPDGGRLTLETRNVELDEADVRAQPGSRAGPHVVIEVADTGTGMDADTCARIFEPFFTTKPKDKGTGLGLSTVYGIVKQSGGHIAVQSEPGAGSTFRVYLPRVDAPVEKNRVAASAAGSIHGTETIMVVEDDGNVRDLARLVLSKYGYTVLTASNGGEALLMCESRRGQVHLLVTDVVMPGLSGRQLADRLAELEPGMRVLFTSGYTANVIAGQGVLEEGVEFIPKPFSPKDLVQKVRAVLDGSR